MRAPILDAYAVIAYLRGERAASRVGQLLAQPTVLSVVNAAEVLDQLVRVFGRDADHVHGDLALLEHAGMAIEPLTTEIALSAGRLRAGHYHRTLNAGSLADCVAAATALAGSRPLATSDPALARVVRAEGGAIIGLPDSAGRVP